MRTFEEKLRELINEHSVESESNTPDYVLATFVSRCLDAFAVAVNERDCFYGDDHNVGEVIE